MRRYCSLPFVPPTPLSPSSHLGVLRSSSSPSTTSPFFYTNSHLRLPPSLPPLPLTVPDTLLTLIHRQPLCVCVIVCAFVFVCFLFTQVVAATPHTHTTRSLPPRSFHTYIQHSHTTHTLGQKKPKPPPSFIHPPHPSLPPPLHPPPPTPNAAYGLSPPVVTILSDSARTNPLPSSPSLSHTHPSSGSFS